jgi:hypothetical protein
VPSTLSEPCIITKVLKHLVASTPAAKKYIMSIIFIGSSSSIFVTRTQSQLNSCGLSVTIIDPQFGNNDLYGHGLLPKLIRMFGRYRFLSGEIKKHPKESIAVIHFLSTDCSWMVPLLKKRFPRVLGLAYGSDVLRRNKRNDILLRHGLKRLDVVAATNTNILETLCRDFPCLAEKNSHIIRFGLPVLDELLKLAGVSRRKAKATLDFDPGKSLVSLGYSASPGQRQIELIDFFEAHATELGHLNFVVPVQYGSQKYASVVRMRCEDANMRLGVKRFNVLSEFHDPERAAWMRIATDVLINHSISDAFSGTVQEIVFAGNLVLAGSHLPYQKMPGFSSSIKPYETLEQAALLLQEESLAKWHDEASRVLQVNRAALQAISSWDAVCAQWKLLLSLKTA